ncbi:MAG: ASKHA domain-containing protein [Anaerolineales bacterium]
MTLQVSFQPGNISVQTDGSQDILSLARQAGFLIDSQCGGQGTCDHCQMRLVDGQLVDARDQYQALKPDPQGRFTSCQAYPRSDAVISVPIESRIGDLVPSTADYSPLLKQAAPAPAIFQAMRVKLPPPTLQDSCSDADRLARELKKYFTLDIHIPEAALATLPEQLRASGWEVSLRLLEAENRLNVVSVSSDTGASYGWAVDIGTTSLAVSLVEMQTGAVIDLATSANPQIAWGADVIARILACDKKAALKSLTRAARERIASLQNALLTKNGVDARDVLAAAVAGNTTMLHIYHGISPTHIRKEPYIPAFTSFPAIKARQRWMVCAPSALLFTCPSVASYVGGDITAGAVAAGVDTSDETILFIDLGTNGEVVLGNKEWALCSSTSAGPCFEGGGITCGMRAEKGAIHAVAWDEGERRLIPAILGNQAAQGICGSGLFEAIAVLFQKGVIDRSGRLDTSSPGVKENSQRELCYEIVPAAESGSGQAIFLTETDIKSFIYSKAAVYAGIETLLKEIEMDWDAVDKVLIAGSLGTHMDLPAAICLGLFPDIDRRKFQALGNTSLAGARLYLLSRAMQARIDAFAARVTCIELSNAPGFMDAYNAALFLPHTELSRFPSVSFGEQR